MKVGVARTSNSFSVSSRDHRSVGTHFENDREFTTRELSSICTISKNMHELKEKRFESFWGLKSACSSHVTESGSGASVDITVHLIVDRIIENDLSIDDFEAGCGLRRSVGRIFEVL